MFNQTTKEAIKVGLAVSLAILISIWFGWEKSYWSAITVYIVAANESYSYAIKKGQNRLLGTLIGIFFAFFLLATFPQEHLLFIGVYCTFLALCVFMSSHHRWGYAATIAFVVCALVVCSGSFEANTTFNVAILRIQQTVLGMVIYTFVFSLCWPKKTEDMFFELLQQAVAEQRFTLAKLVHQDSRNKSSIDQQKQRLNKLDEILSLPLNGSHRLREQRKVWHLICSALVRIDLLLDIRQHGVSIDDEYFVAGEKLISESMLSIKSSHLTLQLWMLETKNKYQVPPPLTSSFLLPLRKRFKNVAKALSILITCLLMWIFIPLPGGFMVPMIASILANVLVTLPDNAIKHVALGSIVWSLFFLGQYALLMPSFTEVWQIVGLCFINAIIIWKSCSAPSLGIQKVLAANLSVVLPMGALQLTPNYSMETPLLMLTLIYICLAVAGFYTKLFNPNS